MKKESKELARLLERDFGLQVGYDGREHYVVRDPKKDFQVVTRFASTPSTARWRENAVKELLAAGAIPYDPYKAGQKMQKTEEKTHQTGLDVAAAMRAHDERTKHVREQVERLFAELGHQDGLSPHQTSGIPTRFAERAAAYSIERGEERNAAALQTSLWQLRHNRRVSAYVLDLFERVVWEWDNNIGRPDGRQNRMAERYEKGEFTCEECGDTFDTQQGLLTHSVMHKTETCTICGEEVSVGRMSRHVKAHQKAGEMARKAATPATTEKTTRSTPTNEAPAARKPREQAEFNRAKAAEYAPFLQKVIQAGKMTEFAMLFASLKPGDLAEPEKRIASSRSTIVAIAEGAFTRLNNESIEILGQTIQAWKEKYPETVEQPEATTTVVERPPTPDKQVETKEPETREKLDSDAVEAILQLVAGSGTKEAIEAGKTLLLKLS